MLGAVTSRPPPPRPDAVGAPRPRSTVVVVAVVLVAANLRTLMASLPPLAETIRADLGPVERLDGRADHAPGALHGPARPGRQPGRPPRSGSAVSVGAGVAPVLVGLVLRGLGDGAVWSLYAGTFVAGAGSPSPGRCCPAWSRRSSPPAASGLGTGLTMVSMMGAGGGRRGGRRPAGDCARRVGPLAARVGPARSARAGRLGARRAGRPPTHPARRRAGRRHPRPAVGERHRLAARGLPHLPVVAVLLRARVALPHLRVAGWSARDAGLLMAVFTGAQLVSGLVAPTLLDHVRRRPGAPRRRRAPRRHPARSASGSRPTPRRGSGRCSSAPGRARRSRSGSSCSCGTPRRRGTAPGSPRWRSSSATPLPPSGPPTIRARRGRRPAASRRSGDCSRSSCCPSSSFGAPAPGPAPDRVEPG